MMLCTSGMVDAQHREAVEGHVLDELDESVLDRLEAAVMLEVLGIDVGDHRDRPVEPRKLPSLSSASTTIQSLLPRRAFEP